jgi:hypothetical protein
VKRLMALFTKSERNQLPKRQHAFFVCVFDSTLALRQRLSTAALRERGPRIHDLGQGTHREKFIGLLMTSGPDRRRQIKARADRAPGSAS